MTERHRLLDLDLWQHDLLVVVLEAAVREAEAAVPARGRGKSDARATVVQLRMVLRAVQGGLEVTPPYSLCGTEPYGKTTRWMGHAPEEARPREDKRTLTIQTVPAVPLVPAQPTLGDWQSQAAWRPEPPLREAVFVSSAGDRKAAPDDDRADP